MKMVILGRGVQPISFQVDHPTGAAERRPAHPAQEGAPA